MDRMIAAIAIAAACGALIGFLAFRFGVGGVYFAILTIAFAEFARIGFDHFGWVGGSAGFFLPVANYARNDLWNLRGNPTMFYYVMLALTALAFGSAMLLLKSRIGYYWLAIREDEQAARSLGINTFRYKMIAVVISAAMTARRRRILCILLQQSVSRAGFSYLALDRDHSRSDHRRYRHVVRPDHRRVSAHRSLSELMQTCCSRSGFDVPGAKQVFYGVCSARGRDGASQTASGRGWPRNWA